VSKGPPVDGIKRWGRKAARDLACIVAGLAVLGTTQIALSMRNASPAELAATSAARLSCFRGHIAHDQRDAIAAATVFIAVVRSDGTLLSQGTGFVAAGSATLGYAGPRIVTAAHVVAQHETISDDARLLVFFSDGNPIGTPRLVATGPSEDILVGSFTVAADDIAVIEIADFADARARERFSRLVGLPINSDDVLRIGEASDPIGAVWGFSGAAAIDRQGRVVGVLTGADFRGRVTLELGSIAGSNASGWPVTRPVTLPRRSLIVVEPIRAPEILRALGPGAIHQPEPAETDVTLAGFPLASCAATAAELESPSSEAGRMLLSHWQAAGLEDAWLLPPRLDATKLKLTPE